MTCLEPPSFFRRRSYLPFVGAPHQGPRKRVLPTSPTYTLHYSSTTVAWSSQGVPHSLLCPTKPSLSDHPGQHTWTWSPIRGGTPIHNSSLSPQYISLTGLQYITLFLIFPLQLLHLPFLYYTGSCTTRVHYNLSTWDTSLEETPTTSIQ